jgi:hypothetical protein
MRNITGKYEIKELEKTTILGTATYFGKYKCKSAELI